MRLFYPATSSEVEYIKGWVNDQLPEQDKFEGAYTVAVVNEENEIVAGAIFSSQSTTNIFLSGAISKDGIRTVTKEKLSEMLSIAFLPPFNCIRITALVSPTNKRSQKFVEGLGFLHEGTFRDYMAENTETLIYGLTKSDFEGGDYGWRQQVT